MDYACAVKHTPMVNYTEVIVMGDKEERQII